MRDEDYMRLAIDAARRGINEGNMPFGACIVRDGEVISSDHCSVNVTHDPTHHAEVGAIREACNKLQSPDLSGCVIYSTTEPCAMCFSAIFWANIDWVVYGTSYEVAQDAGLNEPKIHDEQLSEIADMPVKLTGGVLEDEVVKLFDEWEKKGKPTAYK